jgi:hypothetical protein
MLLALREGEQFSSLWVFWCFSERAQTKSNHPLRLKKFTCMRAASFLACNWSLGNKSILERSGAWVEEGVQTTSTGEGPTQGSGDLIIFGVYIAQQCSFFLCLPSGLLW